MRDAHDVDVGHLVGVCRYIGKGFTVRTEPWELGDGCTDNLARAKLAAKRFQEEKEIGRV